MKKYTYTTFIKSFNGSNLMPMGKWSLLWKTILFLIILSLFILLFCLRGCQRQGGNTFGPEQEYITPEGDTLRGQIPRLMNPSNSRRRTPSTPTNGGYLPDDAPHSEWPRDIEGERNPNLPDKNGNRIPPVNPDNRITDPDDGREIDAAHLFVILDSDANDDTFNRFAEELANIYPSSICSIVYYNTLSKTLLLEVKPEERQSVKQNLPNQITDISFYVVDVELLASNFQPNDKAFSYPEYSWQYEPIQAYEAWDITTGSQDVTVAIIDSYFDMYHPDLDDIKVVHPYSVDRGNNNVLPTLDVLNTSEVAFMHGTHVAGIVFGEINNSEGACGIAPSCKFMPISLGSTPTSYTEIEGILYAIYKGAKVINLSIGQPFNPQIVSRMSLENQVEIAQKEYKEKEALWDYIFKLCEERNVTIVWASGNQNILSAMDVSKRNSSTIRVDAVDQTLRKAGFSNFGTLPQYNIENSTISAPGCGIVSSIPYGDYFPSDGTSMAAPIVTGAVALMKSININLKNGEIVEILKATSRPLVDNNIGGLVQIKDALEKVREDFLKYEDVMSNPQLLVGKWESTSNFNVLRDGIKTGEHVKLTMIFKSPSEGILQYQYLDGENMGDICTANIKVDFSDSEITIRDLSNPTSESGRRFVRSIYHCTPDDNGFLRASQESEGDTDLLKFNLRKIKE